MYVIQYILKDTKKKKYDDMSYTYAITHDFNIEDYEPYLGMIAMILILLKIF